MRALQILTLIALLIGACSPFPARQEDGSDGAPAGRLLPTGASPRTPAAENAAGAVYELPTAATLCAIVTADEALNLRSAPREGAPHITYMLKGDQVRVINFAGQWWTVKTSRGDIGYANSKYLQERKCE